MLTNYEKLFAHLPMPEPPEDLLNKVMNRIYLERRLWTLKWRLPSFAIGFIGSIMAAVPAFQVVHSALAESGFAQFLSLIFSDPREVLAYWDSFIIMLLESLPAISIVVFLVTIFAMLESLKYAVRDFR